MSSLILSGDTSGTVTISAPNIAGTNTMSLAAATGTLSPKVTATAVTSTSGASIDFTSIPSWATRITVMFSGVSNASGNNFLIQIGTVSGVETSGYVSTASTQSGATTSSTAGYVLTASTAISDALNGTVWFNNITGNTWVSSGVLNTSTSAMRISGGTKSLSGVLDRVRITFTSADTFDAGTINITYE